jgi:hypothetical protein
VESQVLTGVLRAAIVALAFGAALRAAPVTGAAPDEFEVSSSVQHTQINGLEINIRAVSSAIAPGRACAATAQRWSRAGQSIAAACTRAGVWLLVSRRTGVLEQTLQLQPAAGGSVGYLSELDLTARPGAPPLPLLPLPLGARVTEVVQSSEARAVVVQFTVRLPAAPATALRQLIACAREHSWAVTRMSSVVDFRRGAVAVRGIVDQDFGGSSIVLIERRAVRRQ